MSPSPRPKPAAPPRDVLALIDERVAELSPAQQAVAALMKAEPEFALDANVATLARRAKVSPPTIVRFCRAMDCTGLRHFKLCLAQTLAIGRSPLHRAVAAGDSLPTVVHKVLRGAATALLQLERHVAPEVLGRAIAAIAAARRIDCYGVGNTSGFMASDAQARFARLGLAANHYVDAHLQLISAATHGRRDAVLAISYVGRMPALLEAVSVAKAQRATIVAITQPGTPLAQTADVLLPVVVPADPSMRVGTEAYLAQMVYLELLMVGVGLRRGAVATRQLRRVREVLERHGVDTAGHQALSWAWSKTERTRS